MPIPVPSTELHELVKERLDAREIRYTSGRRSVVASIQMASGPRTAAELARSPRMDVPASSMYRTLSMLAESDGITRPLLEKMSVDVGKLQELVDSEASRLPSVSGGRQPGIAPALQQTFDAAATAAESLKDEYVSTEHLLLGITRTDNKANNGGATVCNSESTAVSA